MQNRPLEGILKRLSQFYFRYRWTYKTRFFHFSIFLSKTNLKNVFIFLLIIAISISIIVIFLEKIYRLVCEL